MRGSVSLLVALLLWSTSAAAEEPKRVEATAVADHAYVLFQEGQHREALAEFRRADAIFHSPAFAVFIGRCQAKLGKLFEAATTLRAVVDEDLGPSPPAGFVKAQKNAKDELRTLVKRLPTVTVQIEGRDPEEVSLIVRGRHQPFSATIDLNPGDHHVEAVAADGSRATGQVTAVEGETSRLLLQFSEPRAPSDGVNARVVGGVVSLVASAGAAGIATYALATAVRFNDDERFYRFRVGVPESSDVCEVAESGVAGVDFNASLEGERQYALDTCDDGHQAEVLQAVMFPTALALGGLGTWLLVSGMMDDADGPDEVVTPIIAPGYAGVLVSF